MPASSQCDICKLNPPAFVASRVVQKGTPRERYERWHSCIRCKEQTERHGNATHITYSPITERKP